MKTKLRYSHPDGHSWVLDESDDSDTANPFEEMWGCENCGNYWFIGNGEIPDPMKRRRGRLHPEEALSCKEIQVLLIHEE
jgi:hypothetical protein